MTTASKPTSAKSAATAKSAAASTKTPMAPKTPVAKKPTIQAKTAPAAAEKMTLAVEPKPAVTAPQAPAKPAAAAKSVDYLKPAKEPETAVSGLILEATAAPLEGVQEVIRQFAETGLGQSRAVFDSLRDAADGATASFEDSTAATRSAASKMNNIINETLLSNATAMFDTMKALSEADSPPHFLEIWTQASQKQIETMVKNCQELTAAMRSCMEEAAKPFVSAYSHSFSG